MKKRILCLVLAVVLIGSAVFFFTYGKLTASYPYADKDMSKYVNIASKEFVEALYTGAKDPEAVSDDTVRYAIAAAIAKVATETDLGVIKAYDTLYVKYYATVEQDGKTVVVTKDDAMDPTKNTSVQLGTDSDLARLFEEFLLGKDATDTAYTVIKKGNNNRILVRKGDKLHFSYKLEDGTVTKNQTAVVKGSDFLDFIAQGSDITAQFLAAMSDPGVLVGEDITITVNVPEEGGSGTVEKKYTFNVDYVFRDKVIGGNVQEGDVVDIEYCEITTGDNGEDVAGERLPYYGIATEEQINSDFGVGFFEILKTLTIGVESDVITVTKNVSVTNPETGETTVTPVSMKYKLTVKSVTGREDTSALPEEQIERAEKYITFDKTYDADSDAKAENDENLSLAGKTVTYHVAVVKMKTADYNCETIVNSIKYTGDANTELKAYLEAFGAYFKAKKEYDDAVAKGKTGEDLDKLQTKLNDAINATEAPELAYLESLEAEDDTPLASLKAAAKAYDDAKKDSAKTEDEIAALKYAFAEKKNAYLASKGSYTLLADQVAVDEYWDYQKEVTQDEADTKFSYAIAKEIWNALLENVKATVKYPSRAVAVAKKGLMNSLKDNYYSNRDSKYSEYSSFKSYLKQSVYKDQDYKQAMQAEAEQIVLEKMVLYRLADLYEVTLTTSQESTASLYSYIYGVPIDEAKAASLFDNVMRAITEAVCPALVDTED